MSLESDLERIRKLALKESARLANERANATSEIREMVKRHLPEWMRVIEKNIAIGRGGGRYEFFNSEGRCEWRTGNPIVPRIEIPYTDVYAYGDQLQEILGKPFYVQVSLYNPGPDGDWYSDSITIGWYG